MKPFSRSLFLLISLFVSGSAYALSTDRDQPAEIEADDIEFDFKKGTRTYTNNVLIVQGTLRLKADKLETIYVNDELDHATAWGSLARFKQRPDGKDQDVEGWARKIIVDQKNNILTLVGKAALKQGADTARGDTIIYNMATDTLRVKGGARVGAAGKNGQVAPKRKLEDPFKDNNQGPAAISTKKPTNKDSAKEPESEQQEDVEDTVTEKQPKPLKSGRSRLIIQPK